MSDTPLTDAQPIIAGNKFAGVPMEFARTLERELIIAKLALDLSGPHERAIIADCKAHRDENAKLRGLLQNMLDVAENADETGYVTDVGFVDLDKLHEEVRAALAPCSPATNAD